MSGLRIRNKGRYKDLTPLRSRNSRPKLTNKTSVTMDLVNMMQLNSREWRRLKIKLLTGWRLNLSYKELMSSLMRKFRELMNTRPRFDRKSVI